MRELGGGRGGRMRTRPAPSGGKGAARPVELRRGAGEACETRSFITLLHHAPPSRSPNRAPPIALPHHAPPSRRLDVHGCDNTCARVAHQQLMRGDRKRRTESVSFRRNFIPNPEKS